MTKRRFKTFPLDDLTGGINVRDYPSEIEDKQMVELTNFNFEGNKLVSSKGIENIYTSDYSVPIQGMTVDNKDVWHIEGGSLYKNGEIEFSANSYVLTTGAIDGEIWSMTIEGTDYTFKFGFYGDEALAQADLLTQLDIILPSATYTVAYSGSGVYTIVRNDSGKMTFANPNLVREIELEDWDADAKISITIDDTTTIVDGATYSSVNDALDYVISQLPGSTYETNSASDNKFEIARIDASIPSISSVEYDRYTYSLRYMYTDTHYTSQYLDFIQSDIDGIVSTYDKDGESRSYKGYEQVRILEGLETKSRTLNSGTFNQDNKWVGVRMYNLTTPSQLTTVNFIPSVLDGQSARLTSDAGAVLATGNLDGSGNVTFNYTLALNTYYRVEYYTGIYDTAYGPWVGAEDGHIFNVTGGSINGVNNTTIFGVGSVNVNGNLFDEAIYEHSTLIDEDYGAYSYLYINRLDYGTMSISSFNRYTDPDRFPDDTFATSISTSNHKASISVSTYSEVSHVITDDTGLGLKDYGLYNIYASSYGILIYSRNTNEQSDVLNNPKQVFIDLSTGVATDITSTISEPSVGTIYEGKLMFGGYYKTDVGFYDGITFSATDDPAAAGNEMLDFASWSAGSQTVSSGNKGRITGMLEGENGLYIFKNDSIYYSSSSKIVEGTSFNFIFKKITSNGALSQQTITNVDQETFYYDHENRSVRRLGYEKNLTTLRDVGISREVENIFQNIPNDTPTDNYSSLINANFKYPLYSINITTPTSPEVYIDINGTKNSRKFRAPNKTLIYNVENKSWTTKTYTGETIIHSYKGYIATIDGKIFNDNVGNTTETGLALSKEYTFKDDVDWKFFGEIELVGDIEPEDGETKLITLEVLVDGETIELANTATPSIITISSTTDLLRVKNRLELYDAGQVFQFRVGHSGNGKVEISDVYIKWRPDLAQEEYY